MSIITWIVLGAIIGWLAERLAPGGFDGGTAEALAGGVGGGFLGGAVFILLADRGIGGIDVVSLLTAFVGAVAILTALWKVGHAAQAGVGHTEPGAH